MTRFFAANPELYAVRAEINRHERDGDKVREYWHKARPKPNPSATNFTAAEWRVLKEECDYRCLRCGKQEPDIKLSVDHVVPLALGGLNCIGNIQPLCIPCNAWKSNQVLDFRS